MGEIRQEKHSMPQGEMFLIQVYLQLYVQRLKPQDIYN